MYHWHQFDEVVVLNVDEELAKEEYVIRNKDLFSQDIVLNALNGFINSIFLMCLKIITGVGVIIGIIYFMKKNKLNTVGNNA